MYQWRAQLLDFVDAFLSFKAYGPCVSDPKDAGQW